MFDFEILIFGLALLAVLGIVCENSGHMSLDGIVEVIWLPFFPRNAALRVIKFELNRTIIIF